MGLINMNNKNTGLMAIALAVLLAILYFAATTLLVYFYWFVVVILLIYGIVQYMTN
jgi:hypothetical protein